MNFFFLSSTTSYTYLLRDLLVCDVCGHSLRGRVQKNGRRVYVCLNGRAPESLDVIEHVTSIHAVEVETQIWQSLREMLADPWRVVDIWHRLRERGLQASSHDPDACGDPQFAQDLRRPFVEIPLYDFRQRIQRAMDATDFQTRQDLIQFLVKQVVVSDAELAVEYVVPLHDVGRLARATDEFSTLVRFKLNEIRWYVQRLRLSELMQNGLGGVDQVFGQWFATIYLGWLALAGFLIAVGFVQVGLVLDGALIVFLLYLTGYMPQSSEQRLAWASALPPILRLLSYSVPIPDASLVIQLGVVGVPALLAVLIMMHALQQPLSVYGVRLRNLPVQFAIAPLGLLVGLLEWILFEPQLSVALADLAGVERKAFVSLFIVGVTEELVFRGLLQQGALAVFGRAGYRGSGLVYANIAFAVMHIGYGPVGVVFSFGVGMLYGALSSKTGSIFGVLWAHGFSNIVLLALMSVYG